MGWIENKMEENMLEWFRYVTKIHEGGNGIMKRGKTLKINKFIYLCVILKKEIAGYITCVYSILKIAKTRW